MTMTMASAGGAFVPVLALCFAQTGAAAERPHNWAAAERPHIVFVLADDLGWANVGFHRPRADGEVRTPTLDALVKDGIHLERHYAHTYCSPSRSALQTGRLPIHVNVNNYEPYMRNDAADPDAGFSGIPRNMSTVANKLQAAGYATAIAGKWDVGMATVGHAPRARGYDQSLIYFHHYNDWYTMKAGPPCKPSNESLQDLWANDGPARARVNPADGTCAGWPWAENASCAYEDDVFVAELERVIHAHDTRTPLFALFSAHAAHSPYQVPEAYAKQFAFVDDERRGLYAALVAHLDASVRRLVRALRAKAGMWERTLLVFASDNGGPITQWANNWPLRGGKHSQFEGGVRTAAFVSGGAVPPAARGTRSHALVSIADWYATFCALAGVEPADARAHAAGLPPVDGINVWPALVAPSSRGGAVGREEVPLGACEGYRHTVFCASDKAGRAAVNGLVYRDRRSGHLFKLLVGEHALPVWTGPHSPNATDARLGGWLDCGAGGCLFDLDADPTEHIDLAGSAEHARLRARMRARLKAHDSSAWTPDRGTSDLEGACDAGVNAWLGFWGPWVGSP